MATETKTRLIGKWNGSELVIDLESKGKIYSEKVLIDFAGKPPVIGQNVKVLGIVNYDKDDKLSFVKAIKWAESTETGLNEAMTEGSVIRSFYSDKGSVSFCSVILQVLEGFQEVKAFRQVADHLRDNAKRSCLVKAFGRLANASFTDKDGRERTKLTLIVNDESQLTIKNTVPDIEAEFASLTPAYEVADGADIPW
jgi:hypothetical protein